MKNDFIKTMRLYLDTAHNYLYYYEAKNFYICFEKEQNENKLTMIHRKEKGFDLNTKFILARGRIYGFITVIALRQSMEIENKIIAIEKETEEKFNQLKNQL